MKQNWKLFAWIVVGFIFSQLILGTPPAPEPTYQYIVSGYLQRPSGNSKDKFQVILVGKSLRQYPDSLIELTKSNIIYPSNSSISLTDTSGKYYLDLNTQRYDSLGLRVFAVDKPTYTTPLFEFPKSNMVSIYSEWKEEPSGCNGCSTEPTTHKYISGYQVQIANKNILIPY